jgi:HK97 family phage prohead protease
MEHLLLKVAASALDTDLGTFEAVISTATIDREKDIVEPKAMVAALQAWVPTGKKLPLAWNHSTDPADQIGHIDPASAKAVDNEVVVQGWIDQGTDRGAEAWRLVKSGTLGFSFGYLITEGEERKGGGRHITGLDVFEVTATTTPMNNDTRITSWKGHIADSTEARADLRRRADTTALDFASDGESQRKQTPAGMTEAPEAEDEPPTPMQVQLLNSMIGQAREYIASNPDAEDAGEMADLIETLQELLDEPGTEDEGANAPMAEDDKSLRRLADQVALDFVTDGKSRRKRTSAEEQTLRELAARGMAGTEWLFPASELEAARTGEFKAVWTIAYINSLPDSSFLYIEDGGDKDSEGKTTPRSLRHFPVKDDSGAVDMAHLRNALSRIPQSDLPQSVKDSATAKAQRMMDASKSVDVTDKEPVRTRSVDPLREQADATALDFVSDGESRRKPPRQKVAPPQKPELELAELRRRTRDETLIALSGVEEIE